MPRHDHRAWTVTQVALRHADRARVGRVGSVAILPATATVLLLVAVSDPSTGTLVLAVGGIALWAWYLVGRALRTVRVIRRHPLAGEAYVVTVDAEGLLISSASGAHRSLWNLYRAAEVDDDCLVLAARGPQTTVGAVPLDTLDPAIDRRWLAARVGRLIDAQAPTAP